ncbi:MAG TPA: hypothetical protein VGP76_31125 [Planctomycetaceae bacterium]|jgi:hypothetical protein|nr:hypothetical protein [Planctomycetaceae bacterium]
MEKRTESRSNVAIPPSQVEITPPRVKAGDTFNVKVTLSDYVGPGDSVFLRIAYRRLLVVNGTFQLFSIDYGYIDPNNYPTIIEIEHPDNAGESTTARVLPNASQPGNYPAVNLPEDVLVTVYVEMAPEMQCSQVVRVSPA